MMVSLFRKCLYLTVVALLFAASASLAQTTQVTVTGTGDNVLVGEVYVDPYTATVGGRTNTSIICDDWSDNTYVGESWTANVNTVSSVDSGKNSTTPLFGNNPALYNEAAWLSSKLLGNTNPTQQAEISFALWQLTYSGSFSSSPEAYLQSVLGANYSTNAEYLGFLSWLSAAEGEGGFNAQGWEILTPQNGTSGPPQEFLVYVPESSTLILFGADLLGLLALVIVFRRRLPRPIY